MDLDAGNVDDGAVLATTRGATTRMDLDGEQGGDSLELAMGSVEVAHRRAPDQRS